MSTHIDLSINAQGLACPLPLLKAKQGLNSLSCGQTLQISATDPGSVRDFHSFIALSAHELLEFRDADGVYHYLIKKG